MWWPREDASRPLPSLRQLLLVLFAAAATTLLGPAPSRAIINCCRADIGPNTPGLQQPIPHEHSNAPLAPGDDREVVPTGNAVTFPSGPPPGFPPPVPHPAGPEAIPNFRHQHRENVEWSLPAGIAGGPLPRRWTWGPSPAGWMVGWDNRLLRMDFEPTAAGAADNEHGGAPTRHDFGHHFIDEYGYGFDGVTRVTYSFAPGVPANVRDVVSQAFADWAAIETAVPTLRTGIDFQQVAGGDIRVLWTPLAFGTWADTVPLGGGAGALSLDARPLRIRFNSAAGPEVGANCANAADDDGDGRVNEGCPTAGLAPEAGLNCRNAVNDDPADDGVVNDGCPSPDGFALAIRPPVPGLVGPNQVHLYTVALHEIGHALGYKHQANADVGDVMKINKNVGCADDDPCFFNVENPFHLAGGAVGFLDAGDQVLGALDMYSIPVPDFGDAPATFPTLLEDDGARAPTLAFEWLTLAPAGASNTTRERDAVIVDQDRADNGCRATMQATEDPHGGFGLVPVLVYGIEVANGAAARYAGAPAADDLFVAAWFDTNANGVWDKPGERLFVHGHDPAGWAAGGGGVTAIAGPAPLATAVAPNSIRVTVPVLAAALGSDGLKWLRCRLVYGTAGAGAYLAGANGDASLVPFADSPDNGGEVEDHRVEVFTTRPEQGLTERDWDSFPSAPPAPDRDDDGVEDDADNCPGDANPHQENLDGDALGDACDLDDDNDGVVDATDDFPADPARWAAGDEDGDGLADGDEVMLGTDPSNPDSDDDGLPDGDEVALGTDPLNPDSDDDGLTDGAEMEFHVDPLNVDSDADGLGDGVDPDPASGLDDRDGDAVPDDIDNCPTLFNPEQRDSDGDGIGDPCAGGLCVPGPTHLCLAGRRYQVEAHWETSSGRRGRAQAVELSVDTGYFWFFHDTNVEAVAKVLDGCQINDRFWFFAAGLTNVAVDITVTDTHTGTVKTYTNPQGTAFQPIQDTAAFATCTAGAAGSSHDPLTTKALAEVSAEGLRELLTDRLPASGADDGAGADAARTELLQGAPGACKPDDTVLCLNDDRFRIEVEWETRRGTVGVGQAVELTQDTGYFWFFRPTNVELIVKSLDACRINDRFWFFASGLTNVRVTIRVTDTENGATATYVNPLGTPFQPIQDTRAFATCPSSSGVSQRPP